MYRQHLAPDSGMLFLMGHEKDWTFWMRNTLIPLDMIFITKDMKVAGIVQNAEPKTETLRTVGATCLYVLEVNGGWTASKGVIAGAKVRFDERAVRSAAGAGARALAVGDERRNLDRHGHGLVVGRCVRRHRHGSTPAACRRGARRSPSRPCPSPRPGTARRTRCTCPARSR